MGDLQFVFEVAHRSQAPQDQVGAMGDGTVHCEAIETDHLHAGEMARRRADLFDPFVDAERRPFARIAEHRNDHLTKQAHGPLNQVHMTIGKRVETAGVESPHRESAMGGSYEADRCLDFSQRIRAMSLDADAKKVLLRKIPHGLFICGVRNGCLLYTSPSPRDKRQSRMPSSA